MILARTVSESASRPLPIKENLTARKKGHAYGRNQEAYVDAAA